MGATPTVYRLRDLPFPARLVLTVFLFSVGLGYLSALVQLKLQHAPKGELFPSRDETRKIFHNDPPAVTAGEGPQREIGPLERLVMADKALQFGKNGQMAAPFFKKGGAWNRAKKEIHDHNPGWDDAKVEATLEGYREGERQALISWARAGGPADDYIKDRMSLPRDWKGGAVTPEFVNPDGTVKVKSILDRRCVECHGPDGEQAAIPLDNVSAVKKFVPDLPPVPEAPDPNAASPRMSVCALAQSTHVHLLSFSMLYLLTGFILAFTRLPRLLKVVLCPLPLVFQILDIACWWLARLDGPAGEHFADLIPITGGVVGLGLLLHIFVSTFDMYGWCGKAVLVLLLAGAVGGGVVYVKPIVDRTLAKERAEVDAVRKKIEEAVRKAEAEARKKVDEDEKKDAEKKEPQPEPQPPTPPQAEQLQAGPKELPAEPEQLRDGPKELP